MTDETKEPVDIFSLTEIPITLTYEGMGVAPMTFFLRPYLLKEEQDARQAFYALTDVQQEQEKPKHELRMLAALSTHEPEGVPGFDPLVHNIADFFGGEHPMKRKVVSDVMTRYYRVTQPKEFFRGL